MFEGSDKMNKFCSAFSLTTITIYKLMRRISFVFLMLKIKIFSIALVTEFWLSTLGFY